MPVRSTQAWFSPTTGLTVMMRRVPHCEASPKVEPCAPDVAQRHSGYLVGGTSPFGTRKRMPVFVERTVLDLPQIYINGGRRGYLVGIAPSVLTALVQAAPVDCALKE